MNENHTPRTMRSYSTRDVVVAFARQSVAIDTITRALVLQPGQAAGLCRRAHSDGELLMIPPELPADAPRAAAVEIVHLRERLEDTEAQVREFQKVESGIADKLVRVASLTVYEAIVVSVLMQHEKASKSRLYNALYGHILNSGPEPKIVDIFICKIRKKFAPHKIEIGTIWGWGYEMKRPDKDRLRDMMPENLTITASPS